MERIIINNFFNDIIFKKVEVKDLYVIYAAELSSRFSNGTKNYVLALVPEHLGILREAYLDELEWVNFQTRNMNAKKYQGYTPAKSIWKPSMQKGENIMFDIIGRNSENNTFVARGYPKMKMELLCDPKKNTIHQYNATINLLAALLTYKCSIILDLDFIPIEPKIKVSRIPPLQQTSSLRGCIGDECFIQDKYVEFNNIHTNSDDINYPVATKSMEYMSIPTNYNSLLLPTQINRDSTNFSKGAVNMRFKDNLIEGKSNYNPNNIFKTKSQLQRNDYIDDVGNIRGNTIIPLPKIPAPEPDQIVQIRNQSIFTSPFLSKGVKLSQEDNMKIKNRF